MKMTIVNSGLKGLINKKCKLIALKFHKYEYFYLLTIVGQNKNDDGHISYN